ncbi:hypothetical protein HN51_002047 [Arachis hypogaea]
MVEIILSLSSYDWRAGREGKALWTSFDAYKLSCDVYVSVTDPSMELQEAFSRGVTLQSCLLYEVRPLSRLVGSEDEDLHSVSARLRLCRRRPTKKNRSGMGTMGERMMKEMADGVTGRAG